MLPCGFVRRCPQVSDWIDAFFSLRPSEVAACVGKYLSLLKCAKSVSTSLSCDPQACQYVFWSVYLYANTLLRVYTLHRVVGFHVNSSSHSKCFFSCWPSESQAATEVWHTSLSLFHSVFLPPSLPAFPSLCLSLCLSLYSFISLSPFCAGILVLHPLIVCLPSFLSFPLLCWFTLLLPLSFPSPPRLLVFVDSFASSACS